jgi:hypothetical protein
VRPKGSSAPVAGSAVQRASASDVSRAAVLALVVKGPAALMQLGDEDVPTPPPRKRCCVYLPPALPAQLKSVAVWQNREVADCFAEALIEWMASIPRQTGRAGGLGPRELMAHLPRFYTRVNPALWRRFRAVVLDVERGCTECAEAALRAWLTRNQPPASTRRRRS